MSETADQVEAEEGRWHPRLFAAGRGDDMSAGAASDDCAANQVRDRLRVAVAALRVNYARLGATLDDVQSSYGELERTWQRAQTSLESSRLRRLDRGVLTYSAVARLQAQLATMPAIEQAKGILISETGCEPDEAFDQLRRASQRSNVPVRELATRIVQKSIRRVRPPHATAIPRSRRRTR